MSRRKTGSSQGKKARKRIRVGSIDYRASRQVGSARKPISVEKVAGEKIKTCAVEGCDRRSRARQMCSMHYQRWRRRRSPVDRRIPACGETECQRPRYAAGWCRLHYTRHRRRKWYQTRPECNRPGCPNVPISRKAGQCRKHYDLETADRRPKCERPECERPVRAKRQCQKHYNREFMARRTRPKCSVEGCANSRHSKGQCQKHYGQRRYRTRPRPRQHCAMPDCDRLVQARRLCSRHYYQWQTRPESIPFLALTEAERRHARR